MYRGGSSELGLGRGRGGRGRGGGGGGGRGRNRNLLPPPTNRHSSASLRERNTTSVKAAASSSRTVEETLSIVPREVPPAFGMTIRLAPDLMEEIKRVEAQGGTAKIKFDALPNSSTGNIINVGGKEFKFTWCREPGNLCDIYEEHQSGEDGNGVLVEAGCARRKLNVQRTLDESTTSHLKMLSVEAEQRTKSHKLIVLDPATASPSLKKQLTRAEAPWRMSNKQKKEPPPKKRKVDPAPVVIGGPKPSFRPEASTTSVKNRLSASLGPSPSNQYDTPSSCGTGNIAKTHADNVKTRGGESMVASEKDLSTWESNALRNTSGRQETNVNEEIDLHVLLDDLLKEAPMSLKALAKAVGDRTPNEAKLIETILKKIANFQAPGSFLKPGADLEIYKSHSTDSKSSPERQQLLQITDSSRDQLPVPGVSNMENFSVCERKGEGSQDSLHVHLEEKLSAQENVDVEKDLPGILHEEKRFENRDGQARISNSESDNDNNDSGSDRGSSSDSEASSVSKEVSDEDVDIIMSDGDKEQSAERDAIDLPSAEIEGFKKKLPEVSVSHKSTPTARDLQEAELQLLKQRLQFVRNSTKLFKSKAAYEASQRKFLAGEFGRLKLDIGSLNDRVNHLYEYFSASHKRRKRVLVAEPLVQFPAICKDQQPSERKYDLEHLNASAGQMIDPLKELQKSSTECLSRHGQMNPGDSSGKSNKHSDALGNVRGENDQNRLSESPIAPRQSHLPTWSFRSVLHHLCSSFESNNQISLATPDVLRYLVTRTETAQVSPGETAEPIQVLTESSLILEPKSDGESRTENMDTSSLEKSLMLGDVLEGTDLQDASGRSKYKDVFAGFEKLINGSGGDFAPVNFCEALDVNDYGYDAMPKQAIDLVQSTVEIPGVADEFQVDSREVDDKVSEITRSKAVSCGVFETNDEEMYDAEISGVDGDSPMDMHKETHVSHEVLDKRGEGTTSKSNCSSFEVLDVENGVKENDLTSKNQEKMASQTCIKNKSVPSEEAKARKKEAKARKKIAQERIVLGVKKLKLKPPVAPKPKPVISCRHYHRGRCLEGEQCKFSHDTTPETKSLGTPQAASDRPGANVTTSSSNTAAASVLPQKSNIQQTVSQAIARLQATQPRLLSSTTFLKPPSQSNQKDSSDASSSKINEHATPPQLPPLRKPSVAPKGMSFLSFEKTTQEEDTVTV
ncbi:unnamed protein product [Eruca vesicaria subsp. sativa]|uniref:C3H1-type domain-containing protein n=1 Tax=Eruca vesicaria subsp. sativa TaxID=29727 RepID=A0ABC8J2E4_ERUVS|nr:unnamed protein product [Eruca vesicaria subsp. sativa]